MAAMTARLVFVYGTLKRGEPNHASLTKSVSRFVGECCLVEKFPLVVASRYNIPFLLDRPGEGHRVQGEVYEVDAAGMEVLDELEGHPQFYTRREEKVEVAGGQSISAWVYILSRYDHRLTETASKWLEKYSSTDCAHGRPYVVGENAETYEELFS